MSTGPNRSASIPFRVADHLKGEAERVAYLEALLEDGGARVIAIALRDLAKSIGGMTALAHKTGLSRETLYRAPSPQGNPRLDTLSALLAATPSTSWADGSNINANKAQGS